MGEWGDPKVGDNKISDFHLIITKEMRPTIQFPKTSSYTFYSKRVYGCYKRYSHTHIHTHPLHLRKNLVEKGRSIEVLECRQKVWQVEVLRLVQINLLFRHVSRVFLCFPKPLSTNRYFLPIIKVLGFR